MSATVLLENKVSVWNLGPVERIPLGEGRTFQLGHTSVAVFRTRNGQVLATQSLCPHRGGPLADGLTGDDKVVCPLHSYKFNLSTGHSVGSECEALTTYPVRLDEAGDILLTLNNRSCVEGGTVYEQSQRGACGAFGIAND
jgi:nitrite reductase (NADH) small subunit